VKNIFSNHIVKIYNISPKARFKVKSPYSECCSGKEKIAAVAPHTGKIKNGLSDFERGENLLQNDIITLCI